MKWLEEEYMRRLYAQSDSPDPKDLLGAVVFSRRAGQEADEFPADASPNLVFAEGTVFEITLAEIRAGQAEAAAEPVRFLDPKSAEMHRRARRDYVRLARERAKSSSSR